jgi:hypothetical protein
MNVRKKWFGGRGTGRAQGDSTADPIGTCRRSPDGEWLAIMWPSRPSPYIWAVTDYVGSVGFEPADRVAHWPIVGAAPGSPAAGMSLTPHPAPPRVEENRLTVTSAPPPEDGAVCANTQCQHAYAEHRGGISRTKCVHAGDDRPCLCPRFYVEARGVGALL